MSTVGSLIIKTAHILKSTEGYPIKSSCTQIALIIYTFDAEPKPLPPHSTTQVLRKPLPTK